MLRNINLKRARNGIQIRMRKADVESLLFGSHGHRPLGTITHFNGKVMDALHVPKYWDLGFNRSWPMAKINLMPKQMRIRLLSSRGM